ncbi:hypothetical protein N9893_01575 [bacterium]|nr:hypothetical protein [bacterium]
MKFIKCFLLSVFLLSFTSIAFANNGTIKVTVVDKSVISGISNDSLVITLADATTVTVYDLPVIDSVKYVGDTLEVYQRGRTFKTRLVGTALFNVVEIDFTDSPYSVLGTEDMIQIDATSGPVELDWTSAATTTTSIEIQKVDASGNNITVDPNLSETINGSATVFISTQYNSISVYSNGTNLFWR